MRLFYTKEAPGQHAAVRFADLNGPLETVALFRTERDAGLAHTAKAVVR